MNWAYVTTPFFAWFVAGCLKFIVNSIRARRLAFNHIGYGGLPSNHSAIVASTATLVALKEGVSSPAFGVAITLAFIVVLDANGLRQYMGSHARAINKLSVENLPIEKLREKIGHTKIEILAGTVVGICVGYLSALCL